MERPNKRPHECEESYNPALPGNVRYFYQAFMGPGALSTQGLRLTNQAGTGTAVPWELTDIIIKWLPIDIDPSFAEAFIPPAAGVSQMVTDWVLFHQQRTTAPNATYNLNGDVVIFPSDDDVDWSTFNIQPLFANVTGTTTQPQILEVGSHLHAGYGGQSLQTYAPDPTNYPRDCRATMSQDPAGAGYTTLVNQYVGTYPGGVPPASNFLTLNAQAAVPASNGNQFIQGLPWKIGTSTPAYCTHWKGCRQQRDQDTIWLACTAGVAEQITGVVGISPAAAAITPTYCNIEIRGRYR